MKDRSPFWSSRVAFSRSPFPDTMEFVPGVELMRNRPASLRLN